ncbi:hypothetical protein QCN29_03200 [Streptomyces sp. HNM0663]|uniref:Uncharacterized protein n=1 Tax=Streptomyces chengmaiensis TaxID=3040919 RepID=A0ABT6HGB8_9ACTN|nr:hypothetical protein [Streptomyces chengmaiensis]MDH2387810.1 hypothetical protein [Streptomyces chengmaiensis]
MTFEQEWAAHKTEAANTASGADGGANLKTSDAVKGGAAKALIEHIGPGTQKAGCAADESSESAARAFKGWQTGVGLENAHEEWGRQVKNLRSRLAWEEHGLRAAKGDFRQINHEVRSRLAQLGADRPDSQQA